jgi:RecA/RadA recombinase
MSTARGDVDAAVAGLRVRWGAAAPRVMGALALAPEPAVTSDHDATPRLEPSHLDDDRVIHTGFAALDAILGPGGLPKSASVAIRGDGSSGRTTLSLRVVAEAQAQGSVVAWLDLSRSFDPVEAVARGVRLEWLVVITPASLDEGLSIAGSLLAGRSVDLLVLDLPGGRLARTDKPAKVADRLRRLAALARRAETLLLILDAPGLAGGLATAVAESSGLRLELARRSWIRLGRDIVGQRTEALVARNRYGPPGRRATLRILYAEGGERDACLRRDDLLLEAIPTVDQAPAQAPDLLERTHRDATAAPLSPPSPARTGDGPRLRALPTGPACAGRPAVGPGHGHRREPGRPGTRRPAGDPAGERPSARTGGGLRRSGS